MLLAFSANFRKMTVRFCSSLDEGNQVCSDITLLWDQKIEQAITTARRNQKKRRRRLRRREKREREREGNRGEERENMTNKPSVI